jgi:CheY-like chemotaxis protein
MSDMPMSVLLVDDDPHVCEVFRLVMKHHRIPLTVLGDAETAIDYLKDNSHDVVVMDIFLPGMDGYQALKRIRQSAMVRDCRVIATTAYYTNDTEEETRTRGFDGYMPKPINSNELVSYLQSVVARA